MNQSTQSETSYLFAHSNEEIRRLERQAYFVNSLSRRLFRAMLPAMLKLGVATEEEVGIESLEQRLREEAVAQRGAATAIGLMSDWTRKAQ